MHMRLCMCFEGSIVMQVRGKGSDSDPWSDLRPMTAGCQRYVDRAGAPAGALEMSRRTSFTSWTMTMATANQMQ